MADKNFKYGAAERLRTALNAAVAEAKNPIDIIIEIADILGEISGEKNYGRTIRSQIAATYGLALHDAFVLDKEIAEVSARMEKIAAACDNPDFDADERARIGFALESHKAALARLNAMKNAQNFN